VFISNPNANSTTATVSGNGTLRAVYRTIPPNGTLFVDGFESGDFSKWPSTFMSLGETAVVNSVLPRAGTYGAVFSSNGGGGFEGAYAYKSLASSQSELYARGYFRVSQSGIAQNDNRFYFIRFRSGSNDLAYAGWRMVGGVSRWSLIVRDGTGYVFAYSTVSPNVNQWYSVELHWKADSTAGVGELYVDGQLVCSVTGRNTAALGNADLIRLGLAEVYNCAATTVYADDVVVSQTYIGPDI
jgi:hypothetical protein